MEPYRHHLREVIKDHVTETSSDWGREILDNFEDFVTSFWLVKPKAANLKKLLENMRSRPE
jgi:glutamate synthase (NADPH/NADH) large chain